MHYEGAIQVLRWADQSPPGVLVYVTICAPHVFSNVLDALCFSFIKVMQMTHDCRMEPISTNKIIISVMAEFPLAASR